MAYAPSLLSDLVAAQVARTPEAVAVVFGAERLTYRELDARANQLAHYLQGQGIAPDTVVGLVPRTLAGKWSSPS